MNEGADTLDFARNVIDMPAPRRRLGAGTWGVMALLLCVATMVRLHAGERVPIELPLLAMAMAMQGETIAQFGGLSLQTIVVTNNMVKFSNALVGRYLPATKRVDRHDAHGGVDRKSAADAAPVPAPIRVPLPAQPTRTPVNEVVLPGAVWLSYSVGAGAGATAAAWFHWPLLAPMMVLLMLTIDLLTVGV